MDEVVLRLKVINDAGLGGLETAARRRPQIGGQGRRPDHALLPPIAGGDQQIGFPPAIFQDFDVIDFYRTCDLHYRLVEKAVLIVAFPCNPAQIDKNADMATDFVQR